MIATLRQRDFLLAWTGGLISMMGDWVLFISLPIYIYQLTGSALAMSGMFVAQLIPSLALGSVAGVFVDRWNRKRTMIVANLLLATTLLPLVLVTQPDRVWIVYLTGFAQSMISQFFDPAENALLPTLVDESHLLAANSLNALNNNLARLIGPAIGGVVIGRYGLSGVVILDAVSFVAAGALIALVAASGAVASMGHTYLDEAARAWRRLAREWLAGLDLVRRQRAVAILIGLQAVTFLGEGVFGVVFVIWVRDVIDGGARELGWLMSAQAVGGLIGGLLIGRVSARTSTVRLLGVSSILFGALDLALFNYPLVISGIIPGLVLIMLVGIPAIAFGAGFTTLLQQTVRDAYRGRIFGMLGTTSALLMLTGTLLGGALGGVLSPILLLTVQGGSYIAVGLLALALLPSAMARMGIDPGPPERAVALDLDSAS